MYSCTFKHPKTGVKINGVYDNYRYFHLSVVEFDEDIGNKEYLFTKLWVEENTGKEFETVNDVKIFLGRHNIRANMI